MSEPYSLLTNHLWQSTLFAALVSLAAFALKSNQPKTRYWLWLAASAKFLVPFSLLVELGSRVEVPAASPVVPALAVEQITTSFSPVEPQIIGTPLWPEFLVAIWLAGVVVILTRWFRRWLLIRSAVRGAAPLPLAAPITILSSPTPVEPGVFGIFRPVLLVPAGITSRLSPGEFDAIVAHELSHVHRRDNLTAAIHMLVEALFWFHPLVWWIGARLVEERERACDEAVLNAGSHPHIYAQGILNVCKFYLESPLACASGVTGADLRKRIEAIVSNHLTHRLTLARKLMLAAIGTTAVAIPIVIGILNAPQIRAQSKAESLTFEVASIRPADPDARQVGFQLTPGGGIKSVNMGLKDLMRFAYNIPCGKNCDSFIVGGPKWMDSERFDILAKAPANAEPNTDLMQMAAAERRPLQERTRERLKALLAERFQLAVRRETREMPVYNLVVAKGGHKLKESTRGDQNGSMRGGRGEMIAENVELQMLTVNLASRLGRPVVDRTGLKGRYDFRLESSPETRVPLSGPGGPGDKSAGPASGEPDSSIFTELQEQLGLRLESTKGPVDIIVIERAERPSAN
jgi:uncharacterized protein (TIGR03435 family)